MTLPSLLESAITSWGALDATIQRELARTRNLLRSAPAPNGSDVPAEDLARLVEREIIPRLMLAHGGPRPAANEDDDDAESDLDRVIRLAMRAEPASLMTYVGTLLEQEISMETIYVELLIPAARRLGVMWEEDVISFTDVTIGLGRLQQVVHTFGWRSTGHASGSSSGAALFMPALGDQHTFGLYIIEDYFRRAGWRTWIEGAPRRGEAEETVGAAWFDVFGLSAGQDAEVAELRRSVSAVRAASRNPDLFILVGGRLFLENPDLVHEIGADSSASSGGEALLIAAKAVRRLPLPS